MKRKPIQIAAIPYTELSRETLYVVCDDGSLWRVEAPQLATPRTWERLPDIPDAPDPPYDPRD
jgi:hypothetical protein